MIEGSSITELEQRLEECERELSRHTSAVAEAVQVKTFSRRMESALLAKYMVPHLKDDRSASAAKTMALADENYLKELADLRAVFQRAQKHIEDFKVAQTKWETARSLLSMAKAQIQPSFNASGRQM